MRGQPGFFDVDDWLQRLSDLGDQLEASRVGRISAWKLPWEDVFKMSD